MSVCEVAWHEGGSLPETLYACLYLHPVVFSAVLRGLGWAAPEHNSTAFPRLDLRIREGVKVSEGGNRPSRPRIRMSPRFLFACVGWDVHKGAGEFFHSFRPWFSLVSGGLRVYHTHEHVSG